MAVLALDAILMVAGTVRSSVDQSGLFLLMRSADESLGTFYSRGFNKTWALAPSERIAGHRNPMFPLFEMQREAKVLPSGVTTFEDWLKFPRERMGSIHPGSTRKRGSAAVEAVEAVEEDPEPSTPTPGPSGTKRHRVALVAVAGTRRSERRASKE